MKCLLYLPFLLLLSCGSKNDSLSSSGNEFSSSVSQDVSQREMSPEEFALWYKQGTNNLNKQKEIGDMSYSVSYLPAEVMAMIELKRETYSKEKLEVVAANYRNMAYFCFKIGVKNGSGELLKHELESAAQYEQRLKYLSFVMQNDLVIVQGHDTVFSGLYQYERAFNVTSYATVMLAFDAQKIDKSKELTFIFNDQLFNKGFIKFTYSKNQLNNIPNISGT